MKELCKMASLAMAFEWREARKNEGESDTIKYKFAVLARAALARDGLIFEADPEDFHALLSPSVETGATALRSRIRYLCLPRRSARQ
jgi:hypothetical protein